MAGPDMFLERSSRVPVMAILRGFDPRRTLELCERAWDLGIELVEVPIQSSEAVNTLALAAEAASHRGAVVGAGTVTTMERLSAAVSAGAAFTVAPGLDPLIVEASRDAGLPHLPGVGSATEVGRALQLGVTWLKAFPAYELGTGWAGAMHGPFPEAHFVATGGVTVANAESFLSGGSDIVSLGSALADDAQFALLPDLIERLGK
ncbi:bifunctional 4-hydroxy-2-oxoglutarate aldolase/2-dehydro-3-deoxy-phosphogluconate aldolase [Pseudonocardia sp.]|uniref:bifunctional 4-hydroxy-2-oxoglutarate aldolase/2-dehydro-3-deoxy-phosphogluconate aldolase n=1 Tax=Pseudonocardia sp. TaxID=60912 RepID=UPI0031FD3ED7